eukprot:gene18640-24381_t
MSEKHWKTSEHWLTVKGYLYQLDGLLEGFEIGCPSTHISEEAYLPMISHKPFLIHLLLMNANGDLFQIAEKFDQNKAPPSDILDDTVSSSFQHRKAIGKKNFNSNDLHFTDHCSALIKLLPDNSDVLFSHATWDDYQCAGPRVFKHYSYPLISGKRGSHSFTYEPLLNADGSQINHDIYFSSSPGLLSSIDDFYVIKGHGNLAVIETSLDIYNDELLKLIHTDTLLSWMRAKVSNQLAYDGFSWAERFSSYHSGTYANQWMVIDFDKFTSGNYPSQGFLTVLEEVPGYIHYEDLTHHLNSEGYWASYNNPYFDDIFILSGYIELCEADASSCHDTDPRALIFADIQSSVNDIYTLEKVIGYNHFKYDTYSMNDSCNTISCRQDLEPDVSNRYPFGSIDGKVSSVLLSNKQIPTIRAHMGPTHDDLPPFCWNQFEDHRNIRGKRFSHRGQPDCYNYDWQTFPPDNYK